MESQSLPLFYKQPRPLQIDLDSNRSLVAATDYQFTSQTNSVPLNAAEFAVACKHYPILFTSGDDPLPVALLGLRQGENLFVDAKGSWAAGTYIPAYIRRYPFIFMENADRTQYTLCIDRASPLVVEDNANPFYKDGAPSALTQQALAFCQAFQGHFALTQEFARAVHDAGLLVDNRADITLASGEKLSLSGFSVIDETKFNGLSDAVFLQWRKNGWLGLVYCHLLSMANWASLIERTAPKA